MALNTIPDPPKLLTSWKEIACYLGKGVRTVQRWEQCFGLPVRRPTSAPRNIVSAIPQELDAWLSANWMQSSTKSTLPAQHDPLRPQEIRSAVQAHRELLHTTRQLMDGLRTSIQAVAQQCALALESTGESGNSVASGSIRQISDTFQIIQHRSMDIA
jgi:hypothetical protein